MLLMKDGAAIHLLAGGVSLGGYVLWACAFWFGTLDLYYSTENVEAPRNISDAEIYEEASLIS